MRKGTGPNKAGQGLEDQNPPQKPTHEPRATDKNRYPQLLMRMNERHNHPKSLEKRDGLDTVMRGFSTSFPGLGEAWPV